MNDEELIAKMNKLAIEIEEDKKANPEKYSMIYIPISRLEEGAVSPYKVQIDAILNWKK